jgi:16S rRNA (cytosine1402-N4)-methyltransferase
VEPSSYHTPVLLHDVLAFLLTRADGAYIDGTLGGGGHAEAVLQRLGPHGRLLGLDADDDALTAARARLAPFGSRVQLHRSNFRDLRTVVAEHGMVPAHGLLLDLGVSSHQFDDASRGFSFRGDDRLDMRMDRRQELDAAAVVNSYEERALADLLWQYGEERRSRAIARAIARARSREPIRTTGSLAAVVESVVGAQFRVKTLARVFQAIRIEVNGELESLRRAVRDGIDILAPGGRLVIIAYHSLEDRIVKEAFREAAATSVRSGHVLVPDTPVTPLVRVLTPRPVEPDEREVDANPRARSAKLRAAERI